jgi:hypothetical protein
VPDLPTRDRRERELKAAVLAVLEDFAARSPGAVDWIAMTDRLTQVVRGPLVKAYRDAAAAMVAGLDVEFDIDANAGRWVDGYAPALANEVAGSTRAQMAELADDAAAVAALFAMPRAEGIAITEVTRAVSAAELGVVSVAQAATGKRMIGIWQTERDARVCPVCRPLDQTRPEVWQRTAPSGPPAHPRCRCFLRYREAGS